MVVRDVIALVVLGLLICGLATPRLGQGAGSKSTPGLGASGGPAEQALRRLSKFPQRRPASEINLLASEAYLEKQHGNTAAELEILERMTGIIESNIDALDHDALKEHRLRLKEFRNNLRSRAGAFRDASLEERAVAVGRRAWLAHEALTIKRWEAYSRSKKAWKGNGPHPIEVLTEFYANQSLGETGGITIFGLKIGVSDIVDDAIEPSERSIRALGILPRAVDAEMKLSGSKTTDGLRKPLSAIVDAARDAPKAEGVREKLASAEKLLLAMTVESSGRVSRYHLEALNQVLSAYEAVAPDRVATIAAEVEAVGLALDAELRLRDAISGFSNFSSDVSSPAAEAARTKLLEAADQYVEALGRDEKLNEGLAEDLRKAPRELIEHLLKGLHAGSRFALDLAKKTIAELKDDRRDYEAFLIGKRIAPISEQAFGLKSQITQDIVAMILPEALKFTTDAERQDWLARAENLDGRDDGRLIQVLVGHGATEAALHIVRRKKEVANAVGDYELLSVLGTQPTSLRTRMSPRPAC
jgi:hypothetical protein